MADDFVDSSPEVAADPQRDWIIRDQSEEIGDAGYRMLKDECDRLGVSFMTGKRWIERGIVRGGVAGRIFGSSGVLVVHVADLEREVVSMKSLREMAKGARRPPGFSALNLVGNADGMVPLMEALQRVHVSHQTAINWIRRGHVAGKLASLFHREMWMVNENDLVWKAGEKRRKLAARWMEVISVNTPAGSDVVVQIPPSVFDLFDEIRRVCEKVGRPCPEFPARPSQRPTGGASKPVIEKTELSSTPADPLGDLLAQVLVEEPLPEGLNLGDGDSDDDVGGSGKA